MLLRTNVGPRGQQVGESCQARPGSEGGNQAGESGDARTAPSPAPVLDAQIIRHHHWRLGQVMPSSPLGSHHGEKKWRRQSSVWTIKHLATSSWLIILC